MSGPSYDWRKYGSWSVISGKPCLTHARAIVYYKSYNLVVTHPVGPCLTVESWGLVEVG